MSGIYLELARLADEDRRREFTADRLDQRAATRLRNAAACCGRTMAARIRDAATAIRSQLSPDRAAAVCC